MNWKVGNRSHDEKESARLRLFREKLNRPITHSNLHTWKSILSQPSIHQAGTIQSSSSDTSLAHHGLCGPAHAIHARCTSSTSLVPDHIFRLSTNITFFCPSAWLQSAMVSVQQSYPRKFVELSWNSTTEI